MNAVIELLKRVKRALTRGGIAAFVSLCKLLPVQNRVFFYTIRADGKLLENLDCVYRACDCDRVVFAHMLPHSFALSLRARKLMLTSRVIVTDDYLKYCRDTRLRKGQKLIQLWHAPGAFKCFALDAPSRLTEAQERATHAQYTDVCVSSEGARPFYARAFGVPAGHRDGRGVDIAAEEGILAVYGLGQDERVRAEAGDRVLRIIWTEETV